MPINAFGGGPGSGKTYGVMEHVILKAVSEGRFIITNIEGLKPDLIYQFVADKAPAGKIICIGHIRTTDRNAPMEANFFPGEAQLDKPDPVPNPERKTVNGGDLVVIDEATRYWPVGEKVSREHQFFFREHRHFSNEMGDTCDLVVIDPDLTQLARALKGKLEMSSVTRKLKELGVEKYMVDIFPRGKVTGKTNQTRGPYKFDPAIYGLYKSYSHEKAKEQTVDKRQNILGGTFFKIVMPLALLSLVGGVYMGYRFLTAKQAPAATQTADKGQDKGQGVQTPPKAAGPVISDKWRGVGYVSSNAGVTFYMEGEGQKIRILDAPSTYQIKQRQYEFKDGETWVTAYSGASSSSVAGGLVRR